MGEVDERALLEAIRKAPDDDAPRLVYADRLVQRGDPRGELIVVQCALASFSIRDRAPLEARTAALLEITLPIWRDVLGIPGVWLGLRRGLPEAMTVSADVDDLPARLEEAFARAPIRQLTIAGFDRVDDPAGRAAAILGVPGASHLESIGLVAAAGNVNALVTEAIANATHLERLRALDLSGARIGPDGAARLFAAPHLASLERFSLWLGRIGDAGAIALSHATHLARLGTLTLHDASIGDAGAIALARAPHLASLTSLNLRANAIGADGAAAIGERLAALESLNLEGNVLGDAGAERLAQSSALRKLESLDLQRNEIGAVGARALLSSDRLPALRHLEISWNTLPEELVAAIRARFDLRDNQ